MSIPAEILSQYALVEPYEIQSFGSGLINHTWRVNTPVNKFILQRINQNVFKQPKDIAANIRLIADFLKENHPEYLFVTPVETLQHQDMAYCSKTGYYRLFPFIDNSHTVDVVNTPQQAFEAATQFGRFTKLLSEFSAKKLRITLPDFHNLNLRYQQFETACVQANSQRINACTETIRILRNHISIVYTGKQILTNPAFKQRVTHHDTKISNVLFDTGNKGICVIDLDTMMPGYFISDIGDMLRTYLSPVSEEEKNFNVIEIREDYFKAVADGYLSEMKEELSAAEKAHFIYAGKFMIYMQALRFFTDHLNNDIYYGAAYEGHNLVRAQNQIVLLDRLIEKEEKLLSLIT